jgi:flavoprotein
MRLIPPCNNKLVCYIEDVHMGQIDAYGDQTAIEAIRDYLTAQAWLSSRKRRLRRIENVSFFACLSTSAPETAAVSQRVLHRFNLITLDPFTADTVQLIFSTIMDTAVTGAWPSSAKAFSKTIVSALVDISQRVF